MRKALVAAVNSLWVLGCVWEALAFSFLRSRVRGVQLRVLLRIVRENRDSMFGKSHRFDQIGSVADFQHEVPLTSWDDYADSIERIARGETGVLTKEPVFLLEPTGGSTAASKLVPYTRRLQREFSRGINAWVSHLFRWKPRLILGSAYFSITPFGNRLMRSPSGIPVGFEEDSVYLGGVMSRLMEVVQAVPRELRLISDLDTFRYITLLFLLSRKDLSLISVWNPTFLTLLLEPLRGWASLLVEDIASGRIAGVTGIEPLVKSACQKRLRRSKRRSLEVFQILEDWRNRKPQERDRKGRTLYEALWPSLQVISCWADGNAAGPAERLKSLFASTAMQPKGLIATEGFVSFPSGARAGSVLSFRSHFFEFIETTVAGETVRLAHELERGSRYELVLTTSGGLYRYRIRDTVEVIGFWDGCPLIRFAGRQDAVSDLFGEKLAEGHLRPIVEQALTRNDIHAEFWVVAPERDDPDRGFYTLFLQVEPAQDLSQATPDTVLLQVAREIEQGLRGNSQYAYCIRLGQLLPLRVFRISEGGTAAYLSFCARRGQRLGDIKPAALHPHSGWSQIFSGGFIA